MNFNEIFTRNQLALFLGVPRKKLTFLLYNKGIDNCYKVFHIAKNNGETRCISAPNKDLKELQRKLAFELYKYQSYIFKIENIKYNISHGFVKGKNIFTNANSHKKKKYVINFDLENFFDSFHFGRVCGYFERNKYFNLPHEVSIILAQLTCYKGKLPQGAPTSPIITNLICQILDYRLLHIAKNFHLDYTRYADDLTFSTNDKYFLERYDEFFKILKDEIRCSGFEINNNKTRLQYNNSRQIVTGLVVNKKPNINRIYFKNTKAMALSLYKNGFFTINGKQGNLEQLNGRFSFINQIDKLNNQADKNSKHNLFVLNSREKEYRKFLFYKNFVKTDRPLIITEGKTDIIYIKAALKKLYKLYPNLIEMDESGNFHYKISFFSRTKTISYLFGMSIDGADAMKNLYNYFSENSDNKQIYPNFVKYFKERYSTRIAHPIIFLFDNELSNKNKPLCKFFNHIKLKNKLVASKTLKKDLYLPLNNDKLFLATNPLVNGQSESEIEDLFLADVLTKKIVGKSFCRDSKFDNTKFYGKEIFSKYINTNYKNIDFSNFEALLDTIDTIIKCI